MKKILFINACIRQSSRTYRLARRLLDGLDGEITELRLAENELNTLNEEALVLRDKLAASGDLSAPELSAARTFSEADTIVIAAPYWDLAFPSQLKIYLENITVCGVTFRYTPEGIPEGLCRASELFYVTTSGGPIIHNFGYEYVKTLASEFYGIKETRFISAEGLDIYGADAEEILENAFREYCL